MSLCVSGDMHVLPNPFLLLFFFWWERRVDDSRRLLHMRAKQRPNKQIDWRKRVEKARVLAKGRVEASRGESRRVGLATCDEIKKFETISS